MGGTESVVTDAINRPPPLAGCVIVELLLGRPLFDGATPRQQLGLIVRLVGMPSEDAVAANASAFGRSLLPPPADDDEEEGAGGAAAPVAWDGA